MKAPVSIERLTNATRTAVFASPRMTAEYQRRHRWRWLELALQVLARIVLALMLVWVAIAGTTSYVNAERLPRPESAERVWVLLMGGAGLLSAAVGVLSTGRGLTWLPLNLWPRRAYLPVGDDDLAPIIGKTALVGGVVLGTIAALIVTWCPLPLAMQGWREAALPILIGLSVLHGFMLLLFGSANLPSHRLYFSLLSGLALMIVLPLGSIAIVEWTTLAPAWQEALKLAMFLIPTAWPWGAIEYAVIQNNSLGWLFLVPIGALFLWCVDWVRRGVVVSEFRVASDGLCYPVFARGFNNGPTLHEMGQPGIQPPISIPHGAEKESAERHARKQILSAAALTGDLWRNGWWVERFVTYWLTRREKSVAWHLYGDRRAWTYVWLGHVALTLVVGAGLVLTGTGMVGAHDEVALFWMFVLGASLVGEWIAVGARTGPARATIPLCHPLFPVSFGETTRVLLKTYWLRMVCALPLIFALAGCEASNAPEPWEALTTIALVVAAAATGIALAVACFLFGAGSRFTWDPCRFFAVLLVLGSAVSVIPVCLASTLKGELALIAATGYLALCGSTWLYFRWYYHRNLDFHDPTMLRTQPTMRR